MFLFLTGVFELLCTLLCVCARPKVAALEADLERERDDASDLRVRLIR